MKKNIIIAMLFCAQLTFSMEQSQDSDDELHITFVESEEETSEDEEVNEPRFNMIMLILARNTFFLRSLRASHEEAEQATTRLLINRGVLPHGAVIPESMLRYIISTPLILNDSEDYTSPDYASPYDTCPKPNPADMVCATQKALSEEREPSCPVCLDWQEALRNGNCLTVASLGCLKPHILCTDCKAKCKSKNCPVCRAHFNQPPGSPFEQ